MEIKNKMNGSLHTKNKVVNVGYTGKFITPTS